MCPCSHQEYAAGGPLASKLDEALVGYEHSRLDSGIAEGLHRDANLVRSHGHHSKFAYTAAKIRYKENEEVWRSLSTSEQDRFLAYFATPSRIMAHRWPFLSERRLPQPRRVERSTLEAHLYRLYPNNLTDWPAVEEAVDSRKVKTQKTVARGIEAVQLDYFHCVLQPGSLFSVPDNTEPVTLSSNADALMTQLQVFEVVLTDFGRKKTLHDKNLEKHKLPMYVRWHTLEDGSSAQALILKPHELPVCVDASTLIPWRVAASTSFTKWTQREVQSAPGIRIQAAEPRGVNELYTDCMALDIPSFLLFKMMRGQGWSPAEVVQSHTPEEPKHFEQKHLPQRKWYCRLLIRIDEMWAAGITNISARQKEAFYHCLLFAEQKAAVRPNLRVKDYKNLLQGLQGDIPPCTTSNINSEDDSEDNEDAGSDEAENEGIQGEMGEADLEGERPSGEDGDDLDVRLRALGLPSMVEGCPIHLDAGGQQSYSRIWIVCPLTHTLHRGQQMCRKYRNIGPAQTATLGPKEPAAFLGAWARQAADFNDRRGHVACQPSKAQTKAFAEEQHWL